jgi:Holliday junction resolvase
MANSQNNPGRGKASNTAIGRRGERSVGRSYRARGADVHYSPGSRGAYDLLVEQQRGAVLAIQVKATENRDRATLSISAAEARRLTREAARIGARPVFVAKFASGEQVVTYLDSGRRFF